MSEDYSNSPISLAETKAAKAEQCDLWTPRDVLIKMLREIDNGTLEPKDLIVVYAEDLDSKVRISSFQAGPAEVFYRVGMLQDVILALLTRV